MKIWMSPITDEDIVSISELEIENQTIKNNLQNAYFSQVMKLKNVRGIYCRDKLIGVVILCIRMIKSKNECEDNVYSAVKLDTLVIDDRYQNKGIGSKILKILINEIKHYSNKLGYRFLILDALSDKVKWYNNRGFESHNDSESGKSLTTMSVDFADLEMIDEYIEFNT